jgi:hypothetical protein
MTPHLTSHHGPTVQKILAHPTSGNIEWRHVGSLLAAIGRVESERNGKLHISVGAEPEVVPAPHRKDASVRTLVDLRALLTPSARRHARGRPMIGVALLLIAVGAFLRIAITARGAGVSIHTVGVILIIVGVVALGIGPVARFCIRAREPARQGLEMTIGRARPSRASAPP